MVSSSREQIIQAGDVVRIFDPKATGGSVAVIVEIRNGAGIVHFPIINYQYALPLEQQIDQIQIAPRVASNNADDISALLGHLEDGNLASVMARSGLEQSVGEVLGWIKASPTALISLLVEPD